MIFKVLYNHIKFNYFTANFVKTFGIESSGLKDLTSYNILSGHYGEVLVEYYTPRGQLTNGYICDYQWSMEDADVFCSSKW